MSKISSYVRLIRPVNCAMMGFAVVIGAFLASLKDVSGLWLNLAYGFTTGFTLTAASMAINDYYDRQTDAINEPNRPIPSGAVKPEGALILASFLTLIGFLSAYLTNMYCFLAAVIAWVVLATYTTIGKRSGLPGNFLVSVCVAIPFVYGSVAIVDAVQPNVLIFASMAFLSNTGEKSRRGSLTFRVMRHEVLEPWLFDLGGRSLPLGR